jgi:hypothetical protein
MANMNNQGKTPQQYEDSIRFFSRAMLGFILLMILMVLLSGCAVTYPLDPCCDKDNTTEVYYHDNSVYFGYYSGYYYYYGKPHYYPWDYYYNTRPPFYYNMTTHIIINKPVNKPTHRPNRPKVNTHRSNIKVKTNVNRNKVNVKTNRSNKVRVNTRRKPK